MQKKPKQTKQNPKQNPTKNWETFKISFADLFP